MTTAQEIETLRNRLTLWALGKRPATLPEISDWIMRLDALLQQHEM
jgi:hypothetical protein